MIVRDGAILVLEINTIPGLTDTSLFPKAAQAAGISMDDLVQKFVYFVATN
jgi:D-alanine-D-alanine ligase